MRKFLLILFLLLSMVCLQAIIEWDIAGAAVHQSSNAIIENASVITSDGNLVIFWSDTRNGYRELYAQKLDAAGNKFWDEEGVLIGSHPGFVNNLVAVANSQNEVILAYLNSTTDLSKNQLYLQKISADGEKFWGENGRLIDGDYLISQPQLTMHSDGSTTIAWKDNQQNQVKAARLNFNGTVANGWGSDFQQTSDVGIDIISLSRDYSLSTTTNGGILLAANLGTDIYLQKLTPAGEKLFGTLGTLLYSNSEEIASIELQRAAEEYYLAWRLADFITESQLNLQKFDAEANLLWPDNLLVSAKAKKFMLSLDSANQLVIVWKRYRDNLHQILAQKYSASGQEIWDDAGIMLESQANYLELLQMQTQAENTYISYNKNDPELGLTTIRKLQKISPEGSLSWGNQAVDISTFQHQQFPVKSLFSVGQQDIFFAWNRLESGESRIKLQTADLAGNLQIAAEDQVVFAALYGSVSDYQLLKTEDLPLFSWLDNRHGESQIFVQRLTDSGLPIYPENGLALSNLEVMDYDIAFSSENDLIASVWQADHESDWLKSSAVDLAGNQVWEELILYGGDYQNPVSAPLIKAWDQGFLVAFSHLQDWYYGKLVVQKISEAGEIVWDEAGITIADMGDMDLELVDIQEDYIFYRSNGFLDQNIYVQRITSAGEIYPGWPENGIKLNSTENNFLRNIQISSTSQGYLVSWRDYETDEIKLQLVQPSGEMYWTEPLAFSYDASLTDYQITYNESIYLTKVHNDYSFSSLTMQKFSLAGEELWTEFTEIITSNSIRDLQQINLADNIVLNWEEQDSDNLTYLKFQEITPAGDFIYATNGVNLFGNTGFSSQPQIVFAGQYAYASCIDSRSIKYVDDYGLWAAQNLYAQKLSLETLLAENQLHIPRNNLHNYPNPFYPASASRAQNTTISYNLPQAVDSAQIIIYNLKGQKISKLKAAKEAGENKIFWDGRDANQQPVASGIYLYKLVADGKTLATDNMVIIK